MAQGSFYGCACFIGSSVTWPFLHIRSLENEPCAPEERAIGLEISFRDKLKSEPPSYLNAALSPHFPFPKTSCFVHLIMYMGDGSAPAHNKCVPILYNSYIEFPWIHVQFLFNEFPMVGLLGCFQPFAIINNAKMYISLTYLGNS